MIARESAHLVEIGFKPVEVEHQTWGRQIEEFLHGTQFTTREIHKLCRAQFSLFVTKRRTCRSRKGHFCAKSVGQSDCYESPGSLQRSRNKETRRESSIHLHSYGR